MVRNLRPKKCSLYRGATPHPNVGTSEASQPDETMPWPRRMRATRFDSKSYIVLPFLFLTDDAQVPLRAPPTPLNIVKSQFVFASVFRTTPAIYRPSF